MGAQLLNSVYLFGRLRFPEIEPIVFHRWLQNELVLQIGQVRGKLFPLLPFEKRCFLVLENWRVRFAGFRWIISLVHWNL